jgi:hypothetical protein
VLSTQEIKAMADAWIDCATKKAIELDDGRSDAATIAEPVRVACRKHYLLHDNDDRGYAINIVLTLRSNAKKSPAQRDAEIKAASEKWATCVVGGVYKEDDGISPPSVIADRIQPVCHSLWLGTANAERPIVISAVEKVRAKRSEEKQVIVSPPKKMPSTDLRF